MTKLTVILGLLLCFVSTVHAETRGLNVLPIKDSMGKTVGLYKGSYALVLGIADYSAGWPKLPSVIEETKQIEQILTENGFAVTRVLNSDNNALENAFKLFIEKYGYDKNNRLLFFFSGHGYSRKKGAKGYLVPTNAPDPRKDEKGFLRKALPMSQILAWCRQIEAKHAMFLFDSCFSGTIFKSKALPEIPLHISEITSRPVRQFITAGDAGEEVPAKSVFAKSFIRGLQGEADLSRDGYITGSELGMYLRDKVLYYQSGQTPQYGKIRDPDLDEGDFVFLLGSSGAIVKKPVQGKSTLIKIINYAKEEKPRKGTRWFRWKVFIDASPEVLNSIIEVKYLLHPTFPQPVRIRTNKDSNFEFESSGWGEFAIQAHIKFQDGHTKVVKHWLDLSASWPLDE
jgi:prokaryotic YEATS domain/Caspase domain